MKKENPVLVLASGYDPQFAMLNELPHTVCEEVAACTQAGKDATMILLWSELGSCCDLSIPFSKAFVKQRRTGD